jgi:hemerythrin-like domain-containing protein
MSPREIAQWMREEHAVVQDLTQRLRDRVAIIPRTGLKPWMAETCAQLDRFRVHLRKHFDLEETDGYLEAVLRESPRLASQVDRLRHEHDEITRILDWIQQEAGTVTDQDAILIEDCRCRAQNLLRYIKDHEEREDLIVMSVFTNDLGSEG